MNNEIDLWSLLKFYFKYWYVILIITLAGLAVGFAYNTVIQKPVYKSDAKVTFTSGAGQTSSRTVRDISNYSNLVTSRSVLNKAIESSNEDITFEELSNSTSVKNDKNTDVLDISVTTPNAHRSMALANGIVTAFEKEVVAVYNIPKKEVRIVDTAQLNENPVNVRKELQLLLATGAGLILSLIVMFFVFDFKNSQRANNAQETPEEHKLPPENNNRHIAQQPDYAEDDDLDIDIPQHLLKDVPKNQNRRTATSANAVQKPGSNYKKQVKNSRTIQ